jgi:hypothetical protein
MSSVAHVFCLCDVQAKGFLADDMFVMFQGTLHSFMMQPRRRANVDELDINVLDDVIHRIGRIRNTKGVGGISSAFDGNAANVDYLILGAPSVSRKM